MGVKLYLSNLKLLLIKKKVKILKVNKIMFPFFFFKPVEKIALSLFKILFIKISSRVRTTK